jgi:DNA-binding IclR family transcriptional regulator
MKTIKRAFKILDLFLGNEDGLALENMAVLSGLNSATVRRIASTLVECGYLRKSNQYRSKYFLGWRFLEFSAIIKYSNNIIRIATPHLSEVRQQINETVSMAIWDGLNTSLCQSFISGYTLKVIPDEGIRLAMHATSIGKSILAELPDEELEKYFGNHLERYTNNTMADLNELRKHLMIIRQEGVSFDDEEYVVGVRGVGAALKGVDGVMIGAVGIFGPSVRLTRAKLKEYVPVIKNCALEISRELGYKG